MLVPFFRTILLYLFIIVAFRLMGKRQVAEMQATEFVITILISAVASVPMQDLNIPLLHGIVPIVTLICAEIFLSVLSMHSIKLRKLLSGTPVPIICNGVIDQTALRKVRMTLDDVFETLRLSQNLRLAESGVCPGGDAMGRSVFCSLPKPNPPRRKSSPSSRLCGTRWNF